MPLETMLDTVVWHTERQARTLKLAAKVSMVVNMMIPTSLVRAPSTFVWRFTSSVVEGGRGAGMTIGVGVDGLITVEKDNIIHLSL